MDNLVRGRWDPTTRKRRPAIKSKYYVIKEAGSSRSQWQNEQIVAQEPTFTRAYARLLELGPTGHFITKRIDFDSITPVVK